jgi:hypothetical protein
MPQSVGDQPLSPLPGDSALETLVERARAGDGTAFASLFERYHIPIFRYLERLVGSPDIGRDLIYVQCPLASIHCPAQYQRYTRIPNRLAMTGGSG